MKADDELVEQPFGPGGLAGVARHDPADLLFLLLARLRRTRPGGVELLLGADVVDELGDEKCLLDGRATRRQGDGVGKVVAGEEADEDVVQGRAIAEALALARVVPEELQATSSDQAEALAGGAVVEDVADGLGEPVGAKDDDALE